MMPVSSYVKNENGVPCLFINGKRQSGLAYITYHTHNNRYDDFAKEGYDLFSMPVFFGSNHLNEYAGSEVFSKGIFDDEISDFSHFDEDVEKIINACPNAYIFPRVNVSASRYWEQEHPDELCPPCNGEDGGCRVSFASDLWAEEVIRQLDLFISHIEQMDYAEHIVGYQIAAGNTEEWFIFQKEGLLGKRGEEKYSEYKKKHNITDDEHYYHRFVAELTVARIEQFAAYIKERTNRRLVVGSFYGYAMEIFSGFSGMEHYALGKLLKCKDIDFLCSPVSYRHVRAPGREHQYMLPLASLQQHSKLYFSENDTRTHLSKPLNDKPYYMKPIWFGPDIDTSCSIIKMHFARSLINGHASWWFDMWGGWYSDEKYMQVMRKALKIAKESNPSRNCAEVAVFVDEEAYAFCEVDKKQLRKIFDSVREALGVSATPYELYLASDYEVLKSYKAAILFVPSKTKLTEKLMDYAVEQHIPLLKIDAQRQEDVTSTELRQFYKQAGVHIYCDKEAVVYANDNYIFLHTVENGEYEIKTKSPMILTEMFEGTVYKQNKLLKGNRSYLYKQERQ